jgi:hypothetical protein
MQQLQFRYLVHSVQDKKRPSALDEFFARKQMAEGQFSIPLYLEIPLIKISPLIANGS